MDKLTQAVFDAKHKFQVLSGILLIIFPFVLVCYLFNLDNKGLLFTSEYFSELTDNSQNIINTKQAFYFR